MQYKVNEVLSFASDQLDQGRILSQEGNAYRYLYKEKLYDILIINQDKHSKTTKLKINGIEVIVKSSNDLDQLISQLGFDKPAQKAIKEITAPMPGLIKEIMIEEGQTIEVGDAMFVIEAMKMENIIKSAGTGIIKSIHVKIGDKIDKGNVLAKL